MLRFGPKYTASGAVSAIADLRQRPNETAAAFMDRVQIAVDMINYDVPEADRNPAYYQGYVRMVIAQFGGGLKEEIKSKVFGVPTPPRHHCERSASCYSCRGRVPTFGAK